jgi:threonine/homoserine/homoserine lactone efflux protein
LAVFLILGITLGFASGVQPGPFQTFLITRTLNNGWRSTLPCALVPLISDIPIVILVLVILNVVPGWMENVLRFVGGFFLLYLAFGSFKSFLNYSWNQVTLLQPARQNFLKAITVNLLNPNPYLAWSLIMGPLFLKGWRETPAHGVALLAGFYGSLVFCAAGTVFLFAALRRLGPKVSRVLLGISAVALAGFGCYQLWMGVTSLWFS